MGLSSASLTRAARNNIKIRPAEGADIQGIIEACCESITQSCSADHGNDSATICAWLENKTPESISDWINKPDSLILVAEKRDQILGTALASDTGYLSLMYVHPDHQKMGVGRRLLQQVEFSAIEKKCAAIELKSTQTACTFYQRMGYLITGDEEIFLGMVVVPMAKRILS